MSEDHVPQPGRYRIFSITRKGIGINRTEPALQPIVTEGEDAIFTLKPVISNDPGRTFDISVGAYPYIGSLEEKIYATINEEQRSSWTFQYHPKHKAYFIILKDGDLAWSLPEDPDVLPGTAVTLQTITDVHSDTTLIPYQLFNFIPVSE